MIDLMLYPSRELPAGAIDNRLDAIPRKDSAGNDFTISKLSQTRLQKGTVPFSSDENRDSPQDENRDSPQDEEDARFFPGVKPKLLDSIRDDSPSTLDEQAASMHLLAILDKTDLETLRKASIGRITYAQLFRQPDQYRGLLVTVSGVVRRVHWLELAKNEHGIRGYYQVYLFPSDNPSSPLVMYCLSLPKGFPQGMEVAEEAEATGFMFKRWAYTAGDVIRIAPTLLAKTLQWEKRPEMTPPSSVDSRYIPWVVVGAALLTLLTAWFVYLNTRISHGN